MHNRNSNFRFTFVLIALLGNDLPEFFAMLFSIFSHRTDDYPLICKVRCILNSNSRRYRFCNRTELKANKVTTVLESLLYSLCDLMGHIGGR